MGSACGTYGAVPTWNWWGNQKERDHLEDTGLRRENNIKMNLKTVVWVGVSWTHLPHDKDKWRALLNTATNLRVPYTERNW
jgi:hypothetical protein